MILVGKVAKLLKYIGNNHFHLLGLHLVQGGNEGGDWGIPQPAMGGGAKWIFAPIISAQSAENTIKRVIDMGKLKLKSFKHTPGKLIRTT